MAQVVVDHEAWPSSLEPTMRNVDVGIARTLPELDNRNEVREVEALNLAAIAAARQTIYLENQYLASRALADALARRLRELTAQRSSSSFPAAPRAVSKSSPWTVRDTVSSNCYGRQTNTNGWGCTGR